MNFNRRGMSKFDVRRICRLALLCVPCLGLRALPVCAQIPQATPPARVSSPQGSVDRPSVRPGEPKSHPTHLLVRRKVGVSSGTMLAVHQALGARVVRELPIVTGLQLVEIADGQTLAAALRFYRTNPHVLYAEPDYIVHASTAPNDPKFSQQWSLQNPANGPKRRQSC